MTQTIEVVNVAQRPVDLDGGRVLADGERGRARTPRSRTSRSRPACSPPPTRFGR